MTLIEDHGSYFRHVVSLAEEKYDVPHEWLIKTTRKPRKLCRAREMVVKLMKEKFPTISQPQLGRLMGLDHSAICMILKRIKRAEEDSVCVAKKTG